jgi:uncharacterized protein (TIGR03437 family)
MVRICALFSLCAGIALGADFVTGQAARLIIGQTVPTGQAPGASQTLLGAAGGVAFAGNTLFVADSNTAGYTPTNNRVLLFNQASQQLPSATADLGIFTGRCPICVGTASVVIGQPDFVSTNPAITQAGLNLALQLASDGQVLVVADTQNNRVLIWNTIPTTNGQPADVVLGQSNFTTLRTVVVDNKSFRRPQGVWVQNGKLFVADSQNNRVLIWNKIPTANDTPADVVLGQPNFNVAPEVDLTKAALNAQNNTLLNPLSVTSDGTHLFVTDLGHSRVMIWNTIPTTNQAPADVEIGQLDFVSAVDNDSSRLCPSNGMDTATPPNPTYPARCGKTLSLPRFTLSDGKRLYVADGGNDRVLIYNTIPTQNAAAADVILGQPDENASVITSTQDFFNPNFTFSAVDVTPTPTSLAWDGTSLYVADPDDRRSMVFTPGDIPIAVNAVRNAASREIFALGSVTISGTVTKGDVATVTINSTNYAYTLITNDTFDTIATALANLINAGKGDPNVFARADIGFSRISLTSRVGGTAGNNITLATTVSTNATITLTASGANLAGGQSTSVIAPGTIVVILGNIADTSAAADPAATQLPYELAGVQVYFDGIRAPLFSVAPGEIRAQMPFEVVGDNSVAAFVRVKHADGSLSATTAIGVPIADQAPGIFGFLTNQDGTPATDPRVAMAYHGSSYATGTISVDGSIQAGDIATISIEDRTYTYTVQSGDTLANVRDALIASINSNTQEKVIAFPAAAFTRIRLRSKVPGPDGNGLPISVSVGTGALVILTATNSGLCCANISGAPLTLDNPAIPGETIVIYATGLGLVNPDIASQAIIDGAIYQGPPLNDPQGPVSSLAGGSTANVLSAALKVGAIGLYEVVLELNSNIPTNPVAQVTISQSVFTSNIVTIPVVNPTPPASANPAGASHAPAEASPKRVAPKPKAPQAPTGSRAPHPQKTVDQ